MQHYGAALALEPGSRRTLDALARLDKTPAQQSQTTGTAPTAVEQGIIYRPIEIFIALFKQ